MTRVDEGKIRAMSTADRDNLWVNARKRKGDPEAGRIVLSGRKGKLLSGCIAKTAEIYVPNA